MRRIGNSVRKIPFLRQHFLGRANLIGLIKQRKWQEVDNVLEYTKNLDDVGGGVPCDNEKCEVVHSLLHFTLKYHPPVSTVKLLVGLNTKAVFEPDCMRRYPLHIAAMHGASAFVITYIVSLYPEAAEVQDVNGKTPLHLAFCDYRWKSQSGIEEGLEIRKSMRKIVQCLCNAAPESVVLEDEKGVSAIESAIEEEADMRVIRSLQKASESFRRLKIRTSDSNVSDREVGVKQVEKNDDTGSVVVPTTRASVRAPRAKFMFSRTA